MRKLTINPKRWRLVKGGQGQGQGRLELDEDILAYRIFETCGVKIVVNAHHMVIRRTKVVSIEARTGRIIPRSAQVVKRAVSTYLKI